MNISKDMIISGLHCEDCAHFNECQYYHCDEVKAKDMICMNFALYIEDLRKKISDLPFSYNSGYKEGFKNGLNASVNAIKSNYTDYFKGESK